MDLLFHVYSKGENVLFHDRLDYIYFHNKIAIASASFKLKIWAFTIMSTHFHAIIEATDETDILRFQSKIKQAYALHYNHKYDFSLRNNKALKISHNIIKNTNELKNKILYVLRNSTHHYVTTLPFQYEFCSAHSLFANEITSNTIIQQYNNGHKKPKDLTYRKRRTIFGKNSVQNQYEIDSNGMITFDSIINAKRVRAIWDGNVKKFMYDINSSITDANAAHIDWDMLDLRASSMSDMDVCQIIDNYSQTFGCKSLHKLNEEQKEIIVKYLIKRMVSIEQIKRCLWL